MTGAGTILDALDAFGLDGPSWTPWRVLLRAAFGLGLVSDEERAIFAELAGGRTVPVAPVRELWVVAGRRAGKTRIASTIATWAALQDYDACLAPGETPTVMLIASDRKQSRVAMRYATGMLSVPPLAELVERRTAELVALRTGVVLEIHTASFRSTRGYSAPCVVLDEVAFWRDEASATPDVEIIAGLRPALATFPHSILVAISSPYARRGLLWETYARCFGKEDARVLVAHAPSLRLNPLLDAEMIDAAMVQDEAAARAEWFAEFRRDVETFVTREAVAAITVPERRELPPVPGVRYLAFVDPSGGSSDAMTLAVAHAEEEKWGVVAILDCLREVAPPFSPETVAGDFAKTLERYGVAEVKGDRYGGEWPREQFRKRGVAYELADRPKSDLYRELLPLINSESVELLDLPKLHAQLLGLERRVGRGGRDSIDHAPNGHDDVVNAACGALLLAVATGARAPVLVW